MFSYDYSYLEKLLVAQQWKEADEETCRKLLEVIRAELEYGRLSDDFLLEELQKQDEFYTLNRAFSRLSQDVLEGFPMSELINLDQLWQKNSDNWFGYSPQIEVWENLGGRSTPYRFMENQDQANQISELFCKEMGWRDMQYNFNDPRLKPKGYLPSYPGYRGVGVGCSPFYITRGNTWRWQDLVLGSGIK